MEQGTTYISIAHRPALRAFHDRMLAIGDGKLGWTLTELTRSKYVEQVNSKSVRILRDRSDHHRAYYFENIETAGTFSIPRHCIGSRRVS